jgi:23S rRNA (pseudouridine1915-N3)-methyltransferase
MIEYIVVGKISNPHYKAAFEYYEKQLKKFKVIEIKESNIVLESSSVLKLLDKDAYKVVLAIEGKLLSSEEFARHLETPLDMGKKIQIIIGGSEGLASSVKDEANLLLSFSKMTFPHQLARVMITEQVYRAIKIIEKHPYHK